MRSVESYRFLIIGLGGLFGFGVVASFALTAETYLMRPVTQFVWKEQGTGSSCNATVLHEAAISQARLIDFASDAAVAINSYDYYNQATIIGSALRQYFTPSGQNSYVAEVNRTGSPIAFRENFVTQTAYRAGVPNIKEVGFLQGRRFWRVEVPIVQFQQSNVDTKRNNILLTMLIVALRPSEANPNGIGIDSISATQNFNTES
jgi:intracellular multiplication protein IcmL